MTTTVAAADPAPGPADAVDPRDPDDRHDLGGRLDRMRAALVRPMPRWTVRDALLVAAVTVLGALLRFWELGRPDRITFDETYYAKGGLSLWLFGIERDSVENADALIGRGRSDVFLDAPDYVVHPEMGKWVIGVGTRLFGVTPFGWRFGTALVGTLVVLLVILTARRLFRSTLIGLVAGVLIAVDGTAIVLSRIALLDGVLAFFVLAAFACLVVDRDRARATLADRMGTVGIDERGRWRFPGPALGVRPWRLAAGVMLGLALGTKWSALWFIAAFGLLTVLWDVGARRTAGLPSPFVAMLRRDALPAFVSLVIVGVLVYLATWGGWFLTDDGWDRQWAVGRDTAWPFIPEAIRSLWHWHAGMYQFHSTLASSHPYESNAWGWLIQARPTAIHYSDAAGCGAEKCTSAITAVGNPLLWWPAVAALPYLVIQWAGRRDWRAGAILCGVVAGWVPWLVLFNGRTVFQFYAVVIAPFMALAMAYVLTRVLGRPDADARRRQIGAAVVGAYVGLVVLAGAYFWPIWSAEPISYAEWSARMWLRSWI